VPDQTSEAAAHHDMPGGHRRTAPPPLDLVQGLVNTRNAMRGYDLLDNPGAAAEWIAGVAPELVPHALPLDLVPLREALRALLLAHNEGGPPDAGAAAELQRIAACAPLVAAAIGDGVPGLVPAAGADPLIARVLIAIVLSPIDAWRRLKVCANPGCRWAFYDASRNRRSSWCDMSICGSRAKMRAYRSREAPGAAPRAEGAGTDTP